jgi:predicted negative regulator of RcsB-dependent stress response
LSGSVVLPVTRRLIETMLVFKLTIVLRISVASLVLLTAVPIAVHYNSLDTQRRIVEKLQAEKEETERLVIEKKEGARKDSLYGLLQESRESIKRNRLDKANKQLDIALGAARSNNEKSEIAALRLEINKKKVEVLVRAGRYRTALPILDELIGTAGYDADLLYNRGVCYAKIGNIQEAVNDLRSAVEKGDSRASALYERINPIRRRVAYYVTRCCDGSTSGAKGRGACSHHHGVCNWNDPVYEDYRKY